MANSLATTEVGFTGYELAYLLALHESESTRMSRERLRLPQQALTETAVAIGASSLLARRLVATADDGDTLLPKDEALIMGAVLTRATRWTEFAAIAESLGDNALLIEGGDGVLLAQPRALGTWWFTPLAPGTRPGDVLVTMFSAAVEQSDGILAVTARSVESRRDRTLTVRGSDDSWELAHGDTGAASPVTQQESLLDSDVRATIGQWMSDGDS